MGMTKRATQILLAVLALGSTVAAQSPDPTKLLQEAIDQLRGPVMSATYTLLVERPGRSKKYVLNVLTDGGERSLIRVVEPKRDAGQAFLTIGSDIWIYNPRLGRVLRLPPSGKNDRFLGSDVSYADLSGRDLEEDYEVALRQESDKSSTLVLVLTPKPRAPTPWGRVEIVLGSKDRLLRKIVYYDQRGQPVKDVELRQAVRLESGRYLITDTLVRDLVREGYQTTFTISDWQVGPVPDRCFTQTALERGCRY